MLRGTHRLAFEDLSSWVKLARESGFKATRMAELCGMSTRHLRRCCLIRFGRSTQDWLDEQRIVAARWLLREQRSVKSVSYSLGFKQVSHFSRQFKEYHGVTPTHFLMITMKEWSI